MGYIDVYYVSFKDDGNRLVPSSNHDIATIEFLQAEHFWNRAASMQGTDHPGGYHSPSKTCCTGESWLNAVIWTNDFRVRCQMIFTFCWQLRSQGFSEFVFNNLYRTMAGTTTLRPCRTELVWDDDCNCRMAEWQNLGRQSCQNPAVSH